MTDIPCCDTHHHNAWDQVSNSINSVRSNSREVLRLQLPNVLQLPQSPQKSSSLNVMNNLVTNFDN